MKLSSYEFRAFWGMLFLYMPFANKPLHSSVYRLGKLTGIYQAQAYMNAPAFICFLPGAGEIGIYLRRP
jgi:hypothetical protein